MFLLKRFLIIFIVISSNLGLISQENIRINVNSNPPGSTWRVSGSNDTSTTPNSAKFRKGQTYNIIFSKSGYMTKTISYIGGSGDINVNLEPEIIDNPEPINIRVNIDSDPQGASWHITGSNDSSNTPNSAKFRKGQTYSIIFSKSGYNSTTISYKGGTGDIFVKLNPVKHEKSKNRNQPEKKQKPNNNDNLDGGGIIKINSNPHGAAFVITGIHGIRFTPTSMKFIVNQTYHITFSMPGYLPLTIVYRGGKGDISVKLQKAPLIKKPPRINH